MPAPVNHLTLDDLNSVQPVYAVVDNSVYGAMMGLVIYMARIAQGEGEASLAVVDANIKASKLLGELSGKLNELHGLLDKPTDTLAGLAAYLQPRELLLRYDINALIVKCGRGTRLDASGLPIADPLINATNVKPLFGSSERTGLAAERGTPDLLVKAWTDTETAWIAKTTGPVKSDVNQLRVAIFANYLTTPPFPIALTDTHQAGRDFLLGTTNGVSNAKLFLDAFMAEYSTFVSNSKYAGTVADSARGMMNGISADYLERLQSVPSFDVKYGLVQSDDGTAINGAMILVQSDSDALSLETNKSMNAGSNKVQLASGYFDAGKGALDQQQRLGRAMINL